MRKENFAGKISGPTPPFISLTRREFLKRMGLLGGGLIVQTGYQTLSQFLIEFIGNSFGFFGLPGTNDNLIICFGPA